MAEQRKAGRPRRWVLRVLGTLFLLGVVAALVDLETFRGALAEIDAAVFAGLVALATADRWLMAAKWKQLAKVLQVNAPYASYLKAYYGATFLSYALPTTLGGDIYRGWRLGRRERLSNVVISMAMERVVGLLAGVGLASCGLVFLFGADTKTPWALAGLVASGLVLLLLALAASFQPRVQAGFAALAGRLGRRENASSWLQTYNIYRNHLRLLAGNLGLALLENGLQIAILYVAIRQMGVETPTLLVLSIISVARFVRRMSMLLDGWGFSEALHILLFGWIGISGGTALAVSVLGHAVTFAASLPGAFLVWSDRREEKRSAESDVQGTMGTLLWRILIPGWVVSIYYAVRDRAKVSPRAEVELSRNLRFGQGVTVSSFTKIKASSGPLSIGAQTGFATGCFVSSGAGGLHIGQHVICGPNVAIVARHYRHSELEVPFEEQGQESTGVTIGDNVWIGANSTVLDGAVLRENTIVVAGSLVNRRYPPNVVIQGAPAKVIMRRSKPEEGE